MKTINTDKIIRNILGSKKTKYKSKRKLRQEIFTPIKGQRFTDTELIKILQDLAQKLGKVPRETDMDQYVGAPSSGTYDYRFGSWNNALNEAGLSIREVYKYTEEKLIKILQKLAQELGRTPKESDIQNRSDLPAVRTFIVYFGSWFNALREANLFRKNKIYTKEDLIKILQQVGDDLSKVPGEHDLYKYPKLPQSKTFVFHFGSWYNALKAAGFKAKKKW